MFDIEGVLRKQLRDAMTSKQTLIFPEGEDPRIVSAASRLVKFANVVLVGSKERAEEMVAVGEVDLECSRKRFFAVVRFVDPTTDELADTLADRLCEVSQGKRWEMTPDEAAQHIHEPVYFAIMAVREGYADAVLGGVVHASRDFFVPCLRILEKEGTVYEMGLFALSDDHPEGIFERNLVMFADVALNPVPTPEALADIAVGACRTFRDLVPESALPEINGALLSYSTRGSGQGPSVERIRDAEPLIARKLAELKAAHPEYASVNIVSEMQISVALSETAAHTKLKEEFGELRGAGRAHVLIVPNLDVGNLLYHLYSTRYPDAVSTLVIGGLKNQALDFSRSSTAAQVARGAKALLLRRFRSDHFARTPRDHFFPRFRVLVINPGSTSTKVALYEGDDLVARKDLSHASDELAGCETIAEQLPVRRRVVVGFLEDNGMTLGDLHAVVGRGGLLRPIESGTYAIDDTVVTDLTEGVSGEHPANLGGLIAHEIATRGEIPSFFVDPPVVDELSDTARLSGLDGVQQTAAWHALSQKSAAKHFADTRNREYDDLDLIVAHVGGGISVGAHRRGRCVKVRNALFDGPMSANRPGSLPGLGMLDLCFSGVSRGDLERRLLREGGLLSYLGTDDLREVERRIDDGDDKAALVFDALTEQVASEIASLFPSFDGRRPHRIILTGGMCHSRRLRRRLRRLLRPLGVKTTIYPGEREMEGLRDGALRVLRGVEVAREYRP